MDSFLRMMATASDIWRWLRTTGHAFIPTLMALAVLLLAVILAVLAKILGA